MRTNAIVVMTGLMAACGSTGDWDEPTGELLEAIPQECPDGSQGTSVTLRLGETLYYFWDAQDTYLDEVSPSTSRYGTQFCNATGNYPLSGGKDRSCLLWWFVNGPIPAGSIVLDAWLDLTIYDSSQDAYPVYSLNTLWGSSATWLNAYSSVPWQVPGAKGPLDRNSNAPFAIITGGPTGKRIVQLNTAGLQLLQAVVNGTSSNFGIMFANATSSDNLRIYGNLAPNTPDRPGLGIRYCP